MLLKLYDKNIDAVKLDKIVQILKNGGVIIYPTDTIYAIGCDMLQKKALERVAKLKKIPLEKANFSLVCKDLSNLSNYAIQIDNQVFKLMKKTLPGPFTYILKASNEVPKIFHSKKKTVGIRVPNNAIALALVQALGNPIIATSVIDDDDVLEYITDPELIYERYGNLVDLVIDGGFGNNIPSTLIDCSNDSIEVLREGLGSLEGLLP